MQCDREVEDIRACQGTANLVAQEEMQVGPMHKLPMFLFLPVTIVYLMAQTRILWLCCRGRDQNLGIFAV